MEFIPLTTAKIGAGMQVRRALPHKQRRRIGAWCFLDHAGPVRFDVHAGMDVGPHPHIGLQTFTWMIKGELLHRDSLGYQQLIQPKQVNLMTAGRGIVHSENTPEQIRDFHSVQLWIALPKNQAQIAPRFEHFPQLPEFSQNGVDYIVLMGEFMKHQSPVPSYSPLVAVDIQATQTRSVCLALNSAFEYGVLLLQGQGQIGHQPLSTNQLVYIPVGEDELSLDLEASSRLLLIGGAPYTDEIALWWNFVVHDQNELEQAYQDWVDHADRFGPVSAYPGPRLQAPELKHRVKFS